LQPELDDRTQPDDTAARLIALRGKSVAPSFVLINGLVLAAISFMALYLTVGDLRAQEMRRVTRDILRMTENAVQETEKSVTSLAHFYGAISVQRDGGGNLVAPVFQQGMAEETSINKLLWVTDTGIWHFEDILKKTHTDEYQAAFGWPSYRDLQNVAGSLEYGQIGYLYRGAWPIFANPVSDPADAPLALITKVRLPDNAGTGILFAVTTPGSVFANSWKSRQDDISRVTIRGRDNGHVLLDMRLDELYGQIVYFTPEVVNDTIRIGGQYWDIRFEVRPTGIAKALTAAPWVVLAIIALLTMLAMYFADRKQRQDRTIAEMSRNLQGAHHELQSRISERDKLFHAMRKSEREYRAVINSVSDIIFETDETGKIVFLNDTWKRITHVEVTDTIGKSLFMLLDAADQMPQKAAFDELVRGERQAYRIETRLNLGGEPKPVEIAFSMLRMAEDKALRVVGTITDVEKRRRAEMAVRQAEQRFRSIFENSVSGIYQILPEGRYINANPALAEILGYDSPAELIEKITDIGQQVYVRPEDRAAFVEKLLFEGRVLGIETEMVRKDGTHIWVMENARVVRSEKGKVEYFEGSIWDVTERKIAEDAMRHARIQAEMSSRTRMEFLANMSHELRTPLNAIIGFSEIIKDEVMGGLGVPVYKEYAQDIYDSGNHLLKIISEILEVSKIDTGNRELAATTFRLSKALKSCMIIMSSRAEQARVSVVTELPEDLPEIFAEELGVKQIMLNLIGNAIKFTPESGAVRVSAHVDAAGEMVIDVTDNGIGMSEAEIKVAMQPFGKVDHNFSTMKSGTGLGLTIVESLVNLHGGRFELISEKGKGTTARVTLPASRVIQPRDGADEEPGHLKVVK
jgi:PAS domain S-box-containing protein